MFTLNHYSQQCIKNNARITDMTAEYNLVKFMQHLLTIKAVILIFGFWFFGHVPLQKLEKVHIPSPTPPFFISH